MLNLCRGGRGVAGHQAVSFEGEFCPLCKDREAMAGKVADLTEEVSGLDGQLKFLGGIMDEKNGQIEILNDKISELEMIIAKLEVDR